jgi:hypothetical protein
MDSIITLKEDFTYNTINPATPLTPLDAQTIAYTSFDKISAISENNYNATFTNGIDNERAEMVEQQGSNHVETRWYEGPTLMTGQRLLLIKDIIDESLFHGDMLKDFIHISSF